MEYYDLDVTKLKYVLYLRKSTDDAQRQVRSIGDQEAECLDLQRRLGLNIIKTIKETKSAKSPNLRPQFREMLDEIKMGKYDAILAWNPDRLARNMLEGGEIIYLVDENIIKDLKFVTHPFTPDPNGKMLLGLAFVLSKQYSDDLSQKISRGVKRSFSEGKIGTYKHGYKRDDEGFQVPDGKMFELIKEAWKLRAEGRSLEEIATTINDKGYERKIKRTGVIMKADAKLLSKLFRDPFYFGTLIQAGQTIDLLQFGFIPATTKEVYEHIQLLSSNRLRPFNVRRKTFFPLKAFLKCSYCEKNMVVAPSTSRGGGKLLYCRCDSKGCPRVKKSLRMKFIFDFIYDFLDNNLKITEREYQKYLDETDALNVEATSNTYQQIHTLEGQIKAITQEIKESSLGLVKINSKSPAFNIVNEKITSLDNEKSGLEEKLRDLRSTLKSPESQRLSMDEFLNLCKNAGAIARSANEVQKDIICRYVFLNLTVDEEKVVAYQLKEPFNTLVKRPFIQQGGDGGN